MPHNQPTGYVVGAALFETMMNIIEQNRLEIRMANG
jgi:hypothetical protein